MRKSRLKSILILIVIATLITKIAHKLHLNYNKKRILCMILTTNESLPQRGLAVWQTWAHKCDKALFACNCIKTSGSKLNDLPILKLDVVEDYDLMANKVLALLNSTYKQHGKDYDWFFLGDDDTFVLVDNLRAFISTRNEREPVTFGYNFKITLPNGFHSGGAGILFTHESMKRIGINIEKNICTNDSSDGFGDLAIGICSNKSGVTMGNSLDHLQRERFHPLSLQSHYKKPIEDWLLFYAQNKPKNGTECCSEESITFHYVSVEEMYNYSRVLRDETKVSRLYETL